MPCGPSTGLKRDTGAESARGSGRIEERINLLLKRDEMKDFEFRSRESLAAAAPHNGNGETGEQGAGVVTEERAAPPPPPASAMRRPPKKYRRAL